MTTPYTLNVRQLGPCPVIRHACCSVDDGPITALVRAPSGREIEVHYSDCVGWGGNIALPYYGPAMSDYATRRRALKRRDPERARKIAREQKRRYRERRKARIADDVRGRLSGE